MKLARDARQVSGREVFIAGSIGPLGEHEETWPEDRGAAVRGAGPAAGRARRRPVLRRDVLRPRGARDRDRGRALGLGPADRGDDDLRRRRRDDWGCLGGPGRRAPGRPRCCRDRDEPRRGPRRGADGAPGDGRLACRWPRCRTSVSRACRAAGSCIPTPRRSTSPSSRPRPRSLGARLIGGCCGTTPTEIGAIRRAIAEDRAPRAPLAVARARAGGRGRARGARDPASADLREGRLVTSVQIDPPLGANYEGLLEVAAAVHGVWGVRGHQRQRDRARRHAPADRRRGDRAQGRDRDDPAPHPARLDDDGPRVGPARRSRRGRPESARGHRRSAGDRRLPGSGGVDEVDSIGLTHLVSRLNRGENFNGKAIDAPTSFFTGVAVNPIADDPDEELDRFRRKLEAGAALRHDSDRLRRRAGRGVPRAAGRLVARAGDPRRVPADESPAGAPAPHRSPGSSCRTRCKRRSATQGHASARSASRTRGMLAALRDVAAGVYVVAPSRQPPSVLDLYLGRALAGRDRPRRTREHLLHLLVGSRTRRRHRHGRRTASAERAPLCRSPARRVPVPDPAADARHRPRDRPVAVRVLGQDRRVRPTRPGSESSGPFSG